MKHMVKSILLHMCILCLAPALIIATEISVLQADYPVQTATVSDNTFVVYIWNNQSKLLGPRWIDQFDFEAGDVFSAYTTKHGELTGKWIESEIGNLTWFQAWVEKEETQTTTTTPATTTTPQIPLPGNLRLNRLDESQLKFDINVWGISLSFQNPAKTFEFTAILGHGAYLGDDSIILGFASKPIGETPAFGSISPDTVRQEQSYTSVQIKGTNTKFKDEPPVKIAFIPAEGITLTNQTTVDNTTVEFDLAIAVNAPATTRTVTVTYDNGKKSITGTNVLTVEAK